MLKRRKLNEVRKLNKVVSRLHRMKIFRKRTLEMWM